jgi:hypothetical protein
LLKNYYPAGLPSPKNNNYDDDEEEEEEDEIIKE